MKRYFYHGIECWSECYGIENLLEILKSGEIKKRNFRTDEKKDKEGFECLSHVCLYRKNENFDYTKQENILNSALNWINYGFVVIISPDIEATYIEPNIQPADDLGLKTDLVDEWRSKKNIPLDKMVGIALPLEAIKEYLQEEKNYKEGIEREAEVIESLTQIISIAQRLNLKIADSSIVNFTDKIDEELQTTSEITHKDDDAENNEKQESPYISPEAIEELLSYCKSKRKDSYNLETLRKTYQTVGIRTEEASKVYDELKDNEQNIRDDETQTKDD